MLKLPELPHIQEPPHVRRIDHFRVSYGRIPYITTRHPPRHVTIARHISWHHSIKSLREILHNHDPQLPPFKIKSLQDLKLVAFHIDCHERDPFDVRLIQHVVQFPDRHRHLMNHSALSLHTLQLSRSTLKSRQLRNLIGHMKSHATRSIGRGALEKNPRAPFPYFTA